MIASVKQPVDVNMALVNTFECCFHLQLALSSQNLWGMHLLHLWIQCLQTQWWGPRPAEVHVYRSRRLSLAGTRLAEQHQEPPAPCGASPPLRPLQALLLNEDSSSCCAYGTGGIEAICEKFQDGLHHLGLTGPHNSSFQQTTITDVIDWVKYLSTLPMKTVMKLRICSRLSAEVSKTSSANRRRKMKKSPKFSAKNSDKQKTHLINDYHTKECSAWINHCTTSE